MSEKRQREPGVASPARVEAVLNGIPFPLLVCRRARILFANEVLLQLIQVPDPNQLIGQPLGSLLHPSRRVDPQEMERNLATAAGDGIGREVVLVTTGSERLLLHAFVRTIPWDQEEALLLTFRSMDESKGQQIELFELREKLNQLSTEMLLLEENLRRQMAATLHDQVSHQLALARMELDAWGLDSDEHGSEKIREHLDHLLHETIRQIRDLTYALHPPVLTQLGFVAAVAWLVEKLQQQIPFSLSFQAPATEPVLSTNTATLLFRCVQELLNNIQKHAHCRNAGVEMDVDPRRLRISVWDDGEGMDPARALDLHRDHHYGLPSIRDRMDFSGGTFELESAPGTGSRITLQIGLDREL